MGSFSVKVNCKPRTVKLFMFYLIIYIYNTFFSIFRQIPYLDLVYNAVFLFLIFVVFCTVGHWYCICAFWFYVGYCPFSAYYNIHLFWILMCGNDTSLQELGQPEWTFCLQCNVSRNSIFYSSSKRIVFKIIIISCLLNIYTVLKILYAQKVDTTSTEQRFIFSHFTID